MAGLSFLGGKNLIGAEMLGDCDDADVGVVSRLYDPGPGEPENFVDGLALLLPENKMLPGVGGGRSWVESLKGNSKVCSRIGCVGRR